MDKYAVTNATELQRQELRSVREQIKSYEAQLAEGELTKSASAELQDLLERAAALVEAIAASDAV